MSGYKVMVEHVDDIGLNINDGGKWAIMCQHGNHLIQHTNKKLLKGFIKDVELACKLQCKEDEYGIWYPVYSSRENGTLA